MTQEWDPNAPQTLWPITEEERAGIQEFAALRRRGYFEQNAVPQSLNGFEDESIDSTHPFTWKVRLRDDTVRVMDCRLAVWLFPFWAYTKDAAAGGGVTKTSGASSASTTASGGSSSPTSGASSESSTASGGGDSSGTWSEFTESGAANLAAAGTGASGSAGAVSTSSVLGALNAITGGATVGDHGSHDHAYYAPDTHAHTGGAHTHTGPSHTHTDSSHVHFVPSHVHTIPAHVHGIAHTHTVSISSHAHGMAHTHDVTLENHTHAQVYGIYEGPTASGVTITINGVDRTLALVGAATFSADQEDLFIPAAWLTFPGTNTFSITSATLGRVRVQWDCLIQRTLKA
jgi:hypothetical protein